MAPGNAQLFQFTAADFYHLGFDLHLRIVRQPQKVYYFFAIRLSHFFGPELLVLVLYGACQNDVFIFLKSGHIGIAQSPPQDIRQRRHMILHQNFVFIHVAIAPQLQAGRSSFFA